MNRVMTLLVVLTLIGLGGGVGYHQLGQMCSSAPADRGEHVHNGAEASAPKREGLARRICEIGLVSALAERVGFGPAGEVAKPKGAEDSKEIAKEAAAEADKSVRLSQDEIQKFKITTEVAVEGPVVTHIERPAEVKFNRNKLAHIVPRVPGVVSRVDVSQGEHVEEGQLMAILESRELADAKADYLAAVERRELARDAFLREEQLWKQKVSAEKEYLTAKTEFAEADITVATADQKLRALGLPTDVIRRLSRDDPGLTEYKISSPLSGIVVERHLSLGEAIGTDRAVFIVADVGTVWVDVTIYPSDLASVKPGQRVALDVGEGEPIYGAIEFVTPEVKEATRTGVARLVVNNASGRLRPGMFVAARVQISQALVPLRVPKSAVQQQNNTNVVYVEHEGAFEPRPVKLGRENHEFVEIVEGLQPGEKYVSNGGFTLKSLMLKSQMGEGDGD